MNEVEYRNRLVAAGLAEIYDPPGSLVLKKVQTNFDRHTTNFISQATFVAVHVRDASGNPVPMLLGGASGFARIVSESTLEAEIDKAMWPLDKLPLSGGPYQAGLLFIVPGIKETLRMKGSIEVSGGSYNVSGQIGVDSISPLWQPWFSTDVGACHVPDD